jgi:hypothetical protein
VGGPLEADLTTWNAVTNRPPPYGARARAVLAEIRAHHQAYGIPGRPAPLLVENGWTDDLFPAEHALRVYVSLRRRYPGAVVRLQLGDLGHPRGSNKPRSARAFDDQGTAFLVRYLLPAGDSYVDPFAAGPGAVTAFTQTCPRAEREGGPFTASSWAKLRPGRLLIAGRRAQTVRSGGDAAGGATFDPLRSCACTSVRDRRRAGAATYRAKSFGVTLLGLPTVRATIATEGRFGHLNSRLYDVAPGGRALLVARGVYRLRADQRGRVVFPLQGNGYRFPCGHTIKLEPRGNDAPYVRAPDRPFSVRVSELRASLPLAARPRLRLATEPRAGGLGVRVMTGSRCRRPVIGAVVRLGAARARTNAAGRATLRVRATPDRHTVRATKAHFRAAVARVRATGS